MSYPDSVRYLYALGNELKAGAKFGLERMAILLAALGNPESGQNFVHVAGTNGKGSTSAMIASALQQAGRRTGLYTSPHLIEPTERIRIDSLDIDPGEFLAVFETVHRAAEQLLREGRIDAHPSYFETVTAMALLFLRTRAQISVIEVGLGGRLDATNLITPKLCVITPVAYDHESYLGNSLESIASEKAGILKQDTPVIVARQERVAEEVVARRAEELGCEVIESKNACLEKVEAGVRGSKFRLDGVEYECPLAGRHQVENAVAAILTCRKLHVEEGAIQKGLRETSWPGRLERVSCNPDFMLDGAHNPAGARALAEYLREFFADRPVWIVYGAMRDKAIEEVTDQLFPLAQRLILTAPDFARALRPEAVREMTGYTGATLAHTVPEAIALAREAPFDAAVVFTGSLYLVGEARKLLVAPRDPVS